MIKPLVASITLALLPTAVLHAAVPAVAQRQQPIPLARNGNHPIQHCATQRPSERQVASPELADLLFQHAAVSRLLLNQAAALRLLHAANQQAVAIHDAQGCG